MLSIRSIYYFIKVLIIRTIYNSNGSIDLYMDLWIYGSIDISITITYKYNLQNVNKSPCL